MITEKETIKIENIFDDTKTHRFLWKRVWDKDKPIACVIMINPASDTTIKTDLTSQLVLNNIANFDTYGGVVIVNLYSKITTKLNFKCNLPSELNLPENDNYILKSVAESETVIIAWGKGIDTNKQITARAKEVLEILSAHKDKMKVISDGEKKSLHPLTPSVRSRWILEKFDDTADESQ